MILVIKLINLLKNVVLVNLVPYASTYNESKTNITVFILHVQLLLMTYAFSYQV